MEHKYEGGTIQSLDGSPIGAHYHIDYFLGAGEGCDFEYGFRVDVTSTAFVVEDDWGDWGKDFEPKPFGTLKEATAFCFERYRERHPGKVISPCWGAGAPNKTLEELGYSSDWPPKSPC